MRKTNTQIKFQEKSLIIDGIKIHWENEKPENLQKIGEKENLYKEIYILIRELEEKTDKLGLIEIAEHEIYFIENKTVYSVEYPVPLAKKQMTNDHLFEQRKLGILRFSNSPHSSPAFIKEKKNSEARLLCDFRKLNANTDKEHFRILKFKTCFTIYTAQKSSHRLTSKKVTIK